MRIPFRFSFRFFVELAVVLGALSLFVWAWRADRAWFDAHVFWRLCAAEPSELRRVVVRRVAAVVIGIFLIVVARPRLGRMAGTAGPASVVRIVLAGVLAVVVCDVALRRFPKRKPETKPDPFILGAPGYLWHNHPSKTGSVDYEGRRVWYSIDIGGDRVADERATLDPERPTILFAGESITFGHGVDFNDTYAAKVGAALGVQSANSGVSAYGNDQVYLRVHEELARFARPVAVVTMVLPSQILRNVERVRPHFFVEDDGTIETIPAFPEWIVNSPVRELWNDLFPYHSDEAIRIARAAFAATAREATARGAYPLFLFSNWGPPCYPAQAGSPSLYAKLFDGLNLNVLRVAIDVTFWDEPSHHPDPRGHTQVADALIAALRPIVLSRAATGADAPAVTPR